MKNSRFNAVHVNSTCNITRVVLKMNLLVLVAVLLPLRRYVRYKHKYVFHT